MLFASVLLAVAEFCLASSELQLAKAGAEGKEVSADAQTLAAAGLGSDGAALLEFFQRRTAADHDEERLKALTQELSDPRAETRARAASALIGRGPLAVPALRHAVNDLSDPERAKRAQRCLECIEGSGGAAIVAAACRLLAADKVDGAAEALLAYVPLADDEKVASAVREGLATVAYVNRTAHPALVRALKDPLPIRRAVAAEALCQGGHAEQWPGVRGLLQDATPAVRIRAALALAKDQDAEAIPVLIGLLEEMSPGQRGAAEDYLTELAGEWAPAQKKATDWAGWWRSKDGTALLAEVRKRTLSPEAEARVRVLIRQLDGTYPVRQKATVELEACGVLAVPLLRGSLTGVPLEQKRRIEQCLRKIAEAPDRSLAMAAPRLLALRRPAGATEALLAYLPSADDEAITQEVGAALTSLAVRAGDQRPALVRALTDAHPEQRLGAGVALTKAGVVDERMAVRKLLADDNAAVRVGVALALAGAGERAAVDVLLDALAGAPLEQARKAHESLILLAGDKAPVADLADDAGVRKTCREAWTRWWRDHGASADLSNLSAPRLLGYTLIVEADDNGKGRVVELGRNGKVRWQIDNIEGPADAQFLAGSRVLIAEGNARRVTERNLKGDILWQVKDLPAPPINVQRLANGQTFIATNLEALLVDRAGKPILRRNFGDTELFGAARVRNGDIYCFLTGGTCVRLNAAGQQIKSFPNGRNSFFRGGIDVLPNGRILITQPNLNAVAEFDGDGKSCRRIEVPGVTAASWTPEGHILAACSDMRRVVELDGTGKVLWTYSDSLHLLRARRR